MLPVARTGILISKNNMMKRIAIILFFAVQFLGCEQPSSQSSNESKLVAWWVDVQFVPSDTKINGIHIDAIETDWTGAKRLNRNDVTKIVSPTELAEFEQSPFKFDSLMDVDKDGIEEHFFVGVYKTAKSTGRFLLVEKNNKIVAKFQRDGIPGFSALLKYNGELRWYKCMLCGDYEKIVMANGNYLLIEEETD